MLDINFYERQILVISSHILTDLPDIINVIEKGLLWRLMELMLLSDVHHNNMFTHINFLMDHGNWRLMRVN